MGINKNALIRYKVLDACFRNTGRRYFFDDLIKACSEVLLEMDPNSTGISRKQVFDDIAFMESSEGWSIELRRTRDGHRVYYQYADTTFSINNMPLNELEISQLKSAIDILSQFQGMPQFEWINELVPKLQQGAKGDGGKCPIIAFDSNQYLKGIERIGTLYNAILYKKVMRITYQPFESDESLVFIIHPYYLKQYNNRWFLFGYNPEYSKYDWNLALDRIVSLEEIKGKYQVNKKIDWTEYFEDIIGVTKSQGAALETVVLQFSSRAGKYVESKPIHGSQKAKWIDDGSLEVTLLVMCNYELESLILSYGDSVQVKGPVKLQERIKERLSKALDWY